MEQLLRWYIDYSKWLLSDLVPSINVVIKFSWKMGKFRRNQNVVVYPCDLNDIATIRLRGRFGGMLWQINWCWWLRCFVNVGYRWWLALFDDGNLLMLLLLLFLLLLLHIFSYFLSFNFFISCQYFIPTLFFFHLHFIVVANACRFLSLFFLILFAFFLFHLYNLHNVFFTLRWFYFLIVFPFLLLLLNWFCLLEYCLIGLGLFQVWFFLSSKLNFKFIHHLEYSLQILDGLPRIIFLLPIFPLDKVLLFALEDSSVSDTLYFITLAIILNELWTRLTAHF